jgi:acetyl esterase/lipase
MAGCVLKPDGRRLVAPLDGFAVFLLMMVGSAEVGMKRFLFGLSMAWAVAACGQSLPLDPAMGITTIPLYSQPLPGVDPAAQPTLTVFVPQPGHATGSAIVIAPGGAYLNLASNLEGRQVADWFAARGVTAFVLKYRLGAKNPYPAPLLDAQRAIRMVRSQAPKYGYSPDKIGIIGFSAGGHLAGAAETLYDLPAPATSDPIDHLSARPDFAVLGYAWLDTMEPPVGKEITYCGLTPSIPKSDCARFATDYTPKLHVTSHTPTTFIWATTDDATVPVRASVEFYDAMQKAGAPVELHLFRHGPHGTGLGSGDAALDLWPALLEAWMREQGLLTKN